MESNQNVDPSGVKPAPVAAEQAQNESNAGVVEPNKENKVDYATYLKVLDEKKKLQAAVKAREAADKERSEAELKEKQEWKKLAELREKEVLEIKAKEAETQKFIANSRKMDAFLKALPGEIEKQYWPLIDLEEIACNPETGIPDAQAVQKYATEFQASYGKILSKPNGPKMPNEAANGSGAGLTYEEWLKLPTAEMRKRQKEVRT